MNFWVTSTVLVFFTICFLQIGCTNSNSANRIEEVNEPQLANATAEKEAAEKKEAKEKEAEKKEEDKKRKAIADFLKRSYKGWRLAGMGGDLIGGECDYDVPCDLHLKTKGTYKVIKVIIKQFYKPNNEKYYFVYEMTPIDLALHKIKEIELSGRDAAAEENSE